MPAKATVQRARKKARAGKAATTQAGEFVREEIRHVRQGKHGARNTKQAIAIGLSKARRSGVKLAAPAKGRTSAQTRKKAKRDLAKGRTHAKPSSKRSRASLRALKREPRNTASRGRLAQQARRVAQQRHSQPRSKRLRRQ